MYNPECDIFDIVAAVGFGIICDHPFVDGNKRTALLAMVEILRVSGKLQSPPHLPEESTFQVILDVACGRKTADELAAWLREIAADAKI
jgi:death-on-curing protein